ncbi:PIG-L deacetylase family protein [Halorarius halobius]|uniref:PIG-L deacetylase family protein n=1 Tax=Halorarius halobius TaxID=2962671 RepID=UPI0020CCD716|nr:PIG-L family deacetylase [Halorarius halobius]
MIGKPDRVLALGAHPDDVEIGVGGTLAKHADCGAEVTVAVLTSFPENTEDARWAEAERAAEALGVDIELLDVPADRRRFERPLVGRLDDLLGRYDPDAVFTHWLHDSHQDHVNLTRAVLAATRKNRRSVYMYEPMTPGGIVAESFDPQLYVDVSATVDRKFAALRAHASQVAKHGDGWLDGIEGRSRFRGFQVGTTHAEAFEVVKAVERG